MSDAAAPDRKAAKAALRAAGFSNRQVKALLADGWRGLVDESQAEADDLRDELEALRSTFTGNGA
jgi:hypothetical protein